MLSVLFAGGRRSSCTTTLLSQRLCHGGANRSVQRDLSQSGLLRKSRRTFSSFACFPHQPTLESDQLLLRPIERDDKDALHAAANDPLLWAGHPSKDRWKTDVFAEWFRAAIDGWALVVVDKATGDVLGSSRYYDYLEPGQSLNPLSTQEPAGCPTVVGSEVAIGYTWLARRAWGGTVNAELKRLMLDHAWRYNVDTVWFHVAIDNERSQRAVQKIGGVFSHRASVPTDGPDIMLWFKMSNPSRQEPKGTRISKMPIPNGASLPKKYSFEGFSSDSGRPGCTIVTSTGYEIVSDLPKTGGGNNSAAQPVEYLIAALLGCKNATAHYVARHLWSRPHHRIESIRFTQVTAWRDEQGALALPVSEPPPTSAALQCVSAKVYVRPRATAEISEEDVEQLGKIVEERCPVAATLVHSGCILDFQWLLDDA